MRQLKTMTAPEDVQAMTHQRRRSPTPHARQSRNPDNHDMQHVRKTYPNKLSDSQCQYCGQLHKPSRHACPAFGKSCSKCGKPNHYGVVCRSRRATSDVRELQESDEWLLALDNADNRRVYSHVFVNGLKVKFLLDCGASVNLLLAHMYSKIGGNFLRPPRATLRMFNRQELKTLGMLTATVRHPLTQVEFDVEFYVTEREHPILGIDACRRLDLLRVVDENICALREASASSPSNTQASHHITEADVFSRYADLFDGSLGMLKGDVSLEVDPSIPRYECLYGTFRLRYATE